ncbi:hypothetical protein OSB04_027186 [Centaurea solstitialis]|uniref:Tetraspanin n=1 Tax=Centaurea solstitialis TaxID=347529 RepID=A0AA38W6L5_9ASTR|nr:hypothetical protein OSB04_027186 [Centaurea solstitialis]
MGLFLRVLLTIWLIGGTAGSIYLLARRAVEVGIRVVHLHSQTCLEDNAWWPTCLLAFVCISCIIGLLAIVWKSTFWSWVFSFLVNIGIICVIAVMVWRLLMFGLIRKPIHMAFDDVYKDNSPLDEEYKPMLIDALVADHVWPAVDECLTDLRFCEGVPRSKKLFGNDDDDDDWKIENYYKYFREGCCVPPPRCEKQFASFKGIKDDDDCLKWNKATEKEESEYVKCYNCSSCKAARMATYHMNEDKVRMLPVIIAIFLFIASLFSTMGAFE